MAAAPWADSPRGLRIAVAAPRAGAASATDAGARRELSFLLMCLRAMPQVDRLYLLDAAAREAGQPPHDLVDSVPRVARPQDITHELDIVLDFGAGLPQAWLRRVRALGVRVVAWLCGSSHASLIEPAIFGREAELGWTAQQPDQIWLHSRDLPGVGASLRTLLRAPVREIPTLWAPDPLLREARACGCSYGFDAARRARATTGWNAAILEPNASVARSCFVPMLACEAAYREHPQALRGMMVMHSERLKRHPTFFHFASALDLTRDARSSFEPALPLPECMARYERDIVVSHEWGPGPMGLHFELLYGGYPLVHNSDWLARHAPGFHYPGFAARDAGRRVLEAWRCPAEFWADYLRDARAFLAGLHPRREANVRDLLQCLRGVAGADASTGAAA